MILSTRSVRNKDSPFQRGSTRKPCFTVLLSHLNIFSLYILPWLESLPNIASTYLYLQSPAISHCSSTLTTAFWLTNPVSFYLLHYCCSLSVLIPSPLFFATPSLFLFKFSSSFVKVFAVNFTRTLQAWSTPLSKQTST